ncbi:glycosyl transferase [Geminocystis sp. NIES-3708]|uniref:glycosyltransferase n=1 Tax=Geminocystis sp. NIES-3708 TaxID=1615909 RepID=UPI0005FC7975|nr:glycosyltransferase [Geminocystis sp. NIES-3708]BAQ61645.1 glycosyl transferase [Geminocystis sp. NIES-3708]
MKIIHLNTFDIAGGAARAAYRLHEGLLKIGKESQVLSLYKTSSDHHVLEYPLDKSLNNSDFNYSNYIQKYYINHNRTPISNTLFSLGYSGFNVAELESIVSSDIINLHWITSGFLSPLTVKKILDLGKPVVWTLHDMWSFTGGCHYTAGCQGYESNCLNCPQISEDIFNLPSYLLKEKIEYFNHSHLTIVTPSQWLAKCAKKSQVFQNHRIEVIPYSLDTNIFQPIDKLEAKSKLQFNLHDIILLVGAVTGKEKRKGFLELINSLKLCQNNHLFAELTKNNILKICCFGEPNDEFQNLGITVISFGNINSDQELTLIYSAADIFILPSLEDNFPNTMLESMSCGTPVIAFDIGGIPDLIKDQVSGSIVPYNSIELMSEKIIQLISDRALCARMGKKSREIITKNYHLSVQANNYLQLYQELINNPPININQYSSSSNNDFNQNNRGIYFDKIYGDLVLFSMEKELKITLEKLHQTEVKLRETENIASQYQQTITAMKSSKFWSLREKWFNFKKTFGLPTNED